MVLNVMHHLQITGALRCRGNTPYNYNQDHWLGYFLTGSPRDKL